MEEIKRASKWSQNYCLGSDTGWLGIIPGHGVGVRRGPRFKSWGNHSVFLTCFHARLEGRGEGRVGLLGLYLHFPEGHKNSKLSQLSNAM